MAGRKKSFKPSSVVIAVLVAVWFLVCMIPFFFLILCTLKEQFELMNNGVFSLSEGLYLKNYIDVFTGGIWKYFFNSVIVMAVSLVILLALSALAAYPLSRWTFRLNKPIYSLIVACMSVPIHVTLLPIFMMSVKTGLYDSIWALVGPYVAFNLPISVFILTTFMATIPKDLEEAAKIDGANGWKTFWGITVPLLKPTIIMTFIMSINGTLQLFDESVNLTNGGPANATITMSHYIYNTCFLRAPNFGYGSAMAFFVFIIVAILAFINLKVGDTRD